MKCSVNFLCIIKYAEAKSGFLSITNGRSLATVHQKENAGRKLLTCRREGKGGWKC